MTPMDRSVLLSMLQAYAVKANTTVKHDELKEAVLKIKALADKLAQEFVKT